MKTTVNKTELLLVTVSFVVSLRYLMLIYVIFFLSNSSSFSLCNSPSLFFLYIVISILCIADLKMLLIFHTHSICGQVDKLKKAESQNARWKEN